MGRCGYGRSVKDGFMDNLFLKVPLNDFVYLNQRVYLLQAKKAPCVTTILSDSDTINMQLCRLLDLLKTIVLK